MFQSGSRTYSLGSGGVPPGFYAYGERALFEGDGSVTLTAFAPVGPNTGYVQVIKVDAHDQVVSNTLEPYPF